MDIQIFIVGIIILAAIAYIGKMVWRKTKSFSAKTSCGTDCGCGETRKRKLVNN